ncbi:acyl-ACP--UDP-N-acetylglucosamine O-acyltransferase [Marinicella sp. S1101]|uniref:acyl-ACP--UDP-N-acetylglucosamine O-acyltransferase n=1 Tax=Marinicella marina TaxID=2996016 RepID=UPI0022608B88|nr:acyl-ACP--UDP-N-acetylglucosamine O-acyltransferase [Marinicella marina]MCX7554816.1 acyl-ACP--UDP-N-acetylglucosamine O-acyltransferase [Marinicella marina]MDJ1140951.1 acyl-ACP--UDP-N-acetylglucosamine O-acyltransferase [Marinicella marina]
MIHPTAIIDPSAEIGENVKIGPYCIIEKDTVIGNDCELKSHVVVAKQTQLGSGNKVYPFASIGEDPQDKKFADEPTQLIIGDNNTIREYVTINRGTVDDKGLTQVGDNNWIMAYVHIAHDCILGSHTILANCSSLAGHVHVGDHAILGGFTKIHQFCRIGAHAFSAMDSGFQKDLPPFVMAQGNPAKPRAINFEGLKRRGFDKNRISQIKKAYRILYKSDLKLEQAVDELQQMGQESADVKLMVEFITNSSRSIIR